MARQRSIDNHSDAAAHPLSERGGRRPGCVALSNKQLPGVCRTVKPMPYISRRPFGALDARLRLCAGVPLRSTPACIPSPLRGSGERTDYEIGLDCCRNASKRHHLNNPRQTKCSLGIRVLSLVSVSERRHHINEFFACPETVFGRDQLRSLYNICTVQYLYVYQLYKYCTTIVHILYNCRSRYSQSAEI